jgi:glycosyltransferase involved in cell wall biosynthesis
VPPETVVEHVPYPARFQRFVRRFLPAAAWLPRARRAAGRAALARRPDVVLTSGPPHWGHLIGLSLKRRFGLPWVADFRDPWVHVPLVVGQPPRGLYARWERFWERRVLAGADLVLANAPRAADAFRATFPAEAGKIEVLPNGYDPESFAGLPGPAGQGELRLVHAGELYAGRDPRPLLQALRGLQAPAGRPLRVEFVGATSPHFEDDVRAGGLEGVVQGVGQVGYAQSLRAMTTADVLLLLDTAGRKSGVPAKLYEYLGAGRPVLALADADGDTAAILRQSGTVHRVAPPADADAIRRALGELLAEVAAGPVEPAPAREQFTRESLAGRLSGLMERWARPSTQPAAPRAALV